LSGVRQGGILSPILFNVYVDDVIEELKYSSYGCHVGRLFVGCIMYADDLLLMSPSVGGLQRMLDICSAYGSVHNIVFNPSKTVCASVSLTHNFNLGSVYINNEEIPWVHQFKYLGVTFNARCSLLSVDVTVVKRKFYGALNSVLSMCPRIDEPVKLQLVRSYCLPLLTYCVGALELTCSAIKALSVCWNDAFRKIFNFNRWESVKHLQYFCGCLDFKHIYDMSRYKFLVALSTMLPAMEHFYASLELQYRSINTLCNYYGVVSKSLFFGAVYEHFSNDCVYIANS
jgi:DMSO/TMAO reductase YedYZ heme-binding membrane subunit